MTQKLQLADAIRMISMLLIVADGLVDEGNRALPSMQRCIMSARGRLAEETVIDSRH